MQGQDIPWLLNHWATVKPDHPLLVWEPREGEGRTWTYAQFLTDVTATVGKAVEGTYGWAEDDEVVIDLMKSACGIDYARAAKAIDTKIIDGSVFSDLKKVARSETL